MRFFVVLVLLWGLVGCATQEDKPLGELRPFSADETIYLNQIGGNVVYMRFMSEYGEDGSIAFASKEADELASLLNAEITAELPERLKPFRARVDSAIEMLADAMRGKVNYKDARAVLLSLENELKEAGITDPPIPMITD